jgi:hypothetical protein
MPTSIPRRSSVRAFNVIDLVAGEAEKMASVVDEFVDSSAVHKRSGSLFGTDEVDREQHHKAAKDRPRQKLC